jgi:hypothetical protein
VINLGIIKALFVFRRLAKIEYTSMSERDARTGSSAAGTNGIEVAV